MDIRPVSYTHLGDCIVDGIKYIFSPKGKLQSGWQTVDGKRVFYDYDTALPVYGWVYSVSYTHLKVAYA